MSSMSQTKICFVTACILFSALFPLCAQQAEEEAEVPVVNYRGRRIPLEETEAYVQEIRIPSKEKKPLVIDFFFSREIDPRSVQLENIFLDGQPVDDSAKLSFNHEGTLLRIRLKDAVAFPLSVSLQGVRTYTGGTVMAADVPGLQAQERFRYDRELEQWIQF